ncbi:MAG: 30S ribosomal protein S5 [Candidatus Babeliales bacterium]
MAEIKGSDTRSSHVDAVVNLRRVVKVTKGGKRFSFSAFVVTGDQKGSIGFALGKGKDVSRAIMKATHRAQRVMFKVSLRDGTIPYPVTGKHGSSRVIIRSAYKGTGSISGGAMRQIFYVLGVKDVLAKSFGSRTRENVVKATLNALAQLRSVEECSMLRGLSLHAMLGRERNDDVRAQ